MTIKQLVKVLRRWHISDGSLYCPQCWGQYLAQFGHSVLSSTVRADSRDGNLPWARRWPVCTLCGRDARE